MKENQSKKQMKNCSVLLQKNQHVEDNSTSGYDKDLEDLKDNIEVMLR
jgi:hypothetical protein